MKIIISILITITCLNLAQADIDILRPGFPVEKIAEFSDKWGLEEVHKSKFNDPIYFAKTTVIGFPCKAVFSEINGKISGIEYQFSLGELSDMTFAKVFKRLKFFLQKNEASWASHQANLVVLDGICVFGEETLRERSAPSNELVYYIKNEKYSYHLRAKFENDNENKDNAQVTLTIVEQPKGAG